VFVNPTIQLPYRRGPARPTGVVWITATRFTFKNRASAILATPRALRFWATWRGVQGAIGLSIRFQPGPAAAWTLTGWTSRADLEKFLRSPAHGNAVQAFASRLAGTSHSWEATDFDLAGGWQKAAEELTGA
jgi:hypothetical protein